MSTYNRDGALASAIAVVTCGFSLMAMIFCIVAGGVLVGTVVGMGYFICHAPDGERASQGLLQWGEMGSDGNVAEVGHCTFTDGLMRRSTTIHALGTLLSRVLTNEGD